MPTTRPVSCPVHAQKPPATPDVNGNLVNHGSPILFVSTMAVTNERGNTVADHGYYAYGRDRRGRTADLQKVADRRSAGKHPRLSVHPRFLALGGTSITPKPPIR